MRHAIAFIFATLVLTASAFAQSQTDATKSNSVQGSFQPPLNAPTNEATYVFGTGMLVFADPVTLYGVVAGAGFGFGSAPRPPLGIEAGVILLTGGGTTPADGAGASDVDINTFAGNAVFKYRPFDPAETGWLGLTVYGGPSLGLTQFGMTNDAGTAWRSAVQLGALAGIQGQAIVMDGVEIMLFVGGRASGVLFIPESGDPVSFDPVSIVSPDFGGNITVHLPADLDLSLGSVINFFSGEDDDEGMARTFILGLSWTPDGGVESIADTAKVEVMP